MSILLLDRDRIAVIINKELSNLLPKPTIADPIGHEENLNTLINRLNEKCPTSKFSSVQYALIETLPAQSEIQYEHFTGVITIRIKTPEDDVMTFVGMQ